MKQIVLIHVSKWNGSWSQPIKFHHGNHFDIDNKLKWTTDTYALKLHHEY